MPDRRPRASLPRGIPEPLRDFVRCTADTATLAPGDLDWVPKPKGRLVPDDLPSPSVSFGDAEGGGVDITVAWGFLSVTLTATVADGKLSIASPSPLVPTGDIEKWVDDLNADLEANGKQIADLAVEDGVFHATKQPIPVPADEAGDTAVTAPAPVAVAAATAPPEEPVLRPGAPARVKEFFDKWSGKQKAVGGAGALALGVAAFFLFGGGDGGTAPSPGEAAPPAASSSTSTSTTAVGSSTSSTTTTAAPQQDGERVGMFDDPPQDAFDCSTQEMLASPLDVESVDVLRDGSAFTFRVATNGSPAAVLDPATGDWSGAIIIGVSPDVGDPVAMIAQVHEGVPTIGMMDPETGEVTPNGILVDDASVDFSHGFDPGATQFAVRIQSFHGTGPDHPVACDLMDFTFVP
ncbi:MAG: hypothetical protein KQH83_08290 [Actinobacteria bacterium]|nr:hypothetical protein [Actinomycetota bacterium]